MHARRWFGLLIVGAALAGLALAAGSSPIQAATPTIALVAPSGAWPPGASINVELRISGAANLGAFELDLQYDRTRLELTGVTPGTLLGALSGCDPAVHRCAVALGPREQAGATGLGAYSYGTGTGASGTGVLVVLHFRATGSGGAATLRLANALVTDVNAVPAAPVTQDATLHLGTQLYLPLIRR